MANTDQSLTQLLQSAQLGDTQAADQAASLVYDELRSLADAYLARERAELSLGATGLVHEAYFRLMGQQAPWQNRSHFFGIAATTMRRLLVDHSRRATAARRDRQRTVSLDGALEVAAADPEEILGVHEALEILERLDPRQAKVVELRFFVGLTIDEIAEVQGTSVATVSRDWAMARAWLHQQLRAR
ncbi:MAG: sigma-70 family RNA polymerase sigma factor [Gemmatimonadaceae bacterium]|nr:sigma-70 family RNA polymerase sigma factor [Gemmatimonadaceae bacterium]